MKPIYVEMHSTSTNANGLVSVSIGSGKVVKGSFNKIDWAEGIYYIKTETDINTDNQYDVTSTNQLISVPYAFYAKSAGKIAGMVDVKNIPINIFGVYLGDATLIIGMGRASGIKLPASGTHSFAINFTIPPDYTPGDTIFIKMVCSSYNTGNIVLLPNFVSVSQPGSGFNRGGFADTGLVLDDINITSTDIPVELSGYFISPDNKKELHPGDAVSLGFFRRGGSGNDTNSGDLIIHSIDLRY